jgi:hypothetical protein
VSRLPVVPGHRDQRRDDHLRPATAYSENWEYAPFFIGSSLAKWAVAFIFIPAFYRYEVTTIYQFLLHRFVADGANVMAMIAMALVNLVLLLLIETKRLALGWSWLVIVGTAGTIVLALLFSLPAGSRSAERLRTASR